MNKDGKLTAQEQQDMLRLLKDILEVIKEHVEGNISDSVAMRTLFDICYRQMVRSKYN